MLAVGVGASPVFMGGINANISGSSVLDTSIDAPVLTLAVSSTTYPPQLDIALSFGVQATIHSVRVQADDDYLFGSTFMNDLLPISDAEATAAIKLDSNLGSIVSPAVTFFRARIEWTVTGVTHYTNWSNTQGHGDAVAPSMTSSNSGSSAELVAMAFPITVGEVCYFAISGADAAFLELASSTPATSNTVRLTSNALLNYESKASYAFTITPTDLSGNVGTPQSCTFTVTDVDEIPQTSPFTNVTNATISTVYTSNVGTVSSLAASTSVPVTFSGTGQYRKNGGAWITSATTVQNGDTLEIQITASGSYVTALTGTITIGDPAITWTYRVTTQSDPAIWVPSNYFTGALAGAYYDPSDISTLWKDAAGTSPVTADGDQVIRIDDKSGNGHHLISTFAQEPVYHTGSGKPYVEFGGSDFADCASFTADAQPNFVGLSLKMASVASTQTITDGLLTTNRQAFAVNSTGPAWIINGGAGYTTTLTPTTNPCTLTGLYNGTSSYIRLDGTQSANGNGGTASVTGYRFGMAFNGTSGANYRLYGAVIISADPDATLRGNIETWLTGQHP
jgi:hypothetical protein